MTHAMTTMPKYESYKDSGFEWLEDIPSHWKIAKLTHHLKYNVGFTPESGNSIYYGEGYDWANISDLNENYLISTKKQLTPAAIKKFKPGIAPEGCLLFSFKLSVGAVSIAAKDLYTNEAIAAFHPSKSIVTEYLFYMAPVSIIHNSGENIYGARILNQERINSAKIIVPPITEQQAIAKFLDEKTAQIDQSIGIKEQQIALLKERKQIIIQNAVTKGLDPNAPMKDSGVDWIGDIPEHWDVKKIKHHLKIKNGQDHKEVVSDDGQYPVFGSGGEFAKACDYLYRGEAILMGRKGTIDKPLHVDCDFWTVDTMFYGIPNNKCNTQFLYFSITQMPFAYYSTSTALPSMTQFDLNNNPVAIPPPEDQVAIVKYIENESEKIDAGISAQQAQINNLKEYKASLINSAVTGKIKVI